MRFVRNILVLTVVLSLGLLGFAVFLNKLAFLKIQNQLPFEIQGKMQSYFPGRIFIRDLTFKEENSFSFSVDWVEIIYQPLEFLRTGKSRFFIQGSGCWLELNESLLKDVFSDFTFDFLRFELEFREARKLAIRYLYASGEEGVLYLKGLLSREALDVDLLCFLSDQLVDKLPPFVSEHIFKQNNAFLKLLRLRAEGNWAHPYFNLSSDLVSLEVKARPN